MRADYLALGRCVAFAENRGIALTRGCIGNLTELPHRAPVVLRHVWAQINALPECRDALAKIDWPRFRPSVPDSTYFWLAYYQTRAV
jgi:hypothetical protein